MDEFYTSSFDYSSSCPIPIPIPIPILGDGSNSSYNQQQNMTTHHVAAAAAQYDDDDDDYDDEAAGLERERPSSDIIKAQIANHPLYPILLSSYIDCTKVGAPPEMASVLEEISKENQPTPTIFASSCEIGTDNPELDHFMKSYCDALHKYKEKLSKPLEEATNFLSSIESQLTHLCNCNETLPTYSHHSTADWEKEKSVGEAVEFVGGGEKELKEMVMRKYSGYVRSLRNEMLKKRKKGKLPQSAISALFDWWNSHYRWPYPTEEEKNMLSEMTGLDQKQINNWFINQRKRHWRPSHNMTLALIEGVAAADDAAAAGTTGGGGGDHNN